MKSGEAAKLPSAQARERYMKDFREQRALTQMEMARIAGVKPWLIEMLERDGRTVTILPYAKQVAEAYQMSEEMYYTLIPANYRPGPEYDPDRYVVPDEDFKKVAAENKERMGLKRIARIEREE